MAVTWCSVPERCVFYDEPKLLSDVWDMWNLKFYLASPAVAAASALTGMISCRVNKNQERIGIMKAAQGIVLNMVTT